MDWLCYLVYNIVLWAPLWCEVGTLLCESPQYIELEKTSIINCTVDENYFGIYWYNSTDSRKDTPLLSREGSNEGGGVYPSDEFQILDNGSLSITHATLPHEHTFRVVLVVNKELGLIERRDIEVVVIVKPLQEHPLIRVCGTERGCIIQEGSSTNLKCAVNGARPAPILKWVLRTSTGDKPYPSNSSLVSGSTWFSTASEIRMKWFNSTVLLVCKSFEPPPLMKYSESFVVIEPNTDEATFKETRLINAELGSPRVLECAENTTTFLKWERKLQSGICEMISLVVFGQPWYSKIYTDKYEVGLDGSLVLPNIKAEDEGFFTCLTSDGYQSERKTFDITVYAYPRPVEPIIEGCSHNQYCVLKLNITGNLKCSLYRIRPLTKLEWIVLTNTSGISGDPITFYNHQYSTKDYVDGTFDIHLTTEVRVLDTSQQKLTVACQTKHLKNVLATSVDLLRMDDGFDSYITPVTVSPVGTSQLHFLWITVLFVCVVVVGIVFKCRRARNNKKTTSPVYSQEMAPMMEEGRRDFEDADKQKISEMQIDPPRSSTWKENKSEENLNMKGIFIKQLQNKYRLQYEAVRPIPYIREKMYNINSIFVESTIETEAVDVKKINNSDDGTWEKLNSYHELLNFNATNSSRKIVQGDPGYGKSTLTLQLAHDWSTKQSYSPLSEKEVLILLRLRQLFEIESIYKAIRMFLLPRDTVVTESDIREILQKCSSGVIILDGFDEYPHQDGKRLMDVHRIIAGDMFQEFLVILCTRPLSLPTQLPPRTLRTRLTGFDRRAQESYIKKAVTNDTEVAAKIHKRLKDNPVLGDFCQVPLFFVMFAHMTNENEKFQEVNSVTSFFRHVIRCFHTHLQNKVKDENVEHYEIFENDHANLDKVSFEVLTNNQPMTWWKDDLRKYVGEAFYDYYLRLGILCEEEVYKSSIDESTADDFPYQMEVRFYHKLFCEWYAAHHLCRLAESLNFLNFKKVLRKLDLFDLHYVFRFACGLNPTAARKILKHLNFTKNGEQFAILCTLEQTGKFTDIKEDVSHICSNDIHLGRNDNRVLQRSTIQLMIIASRNEVPISSVWIRNCLSSSDESGEYLRFTNGLTLPSLDTMLHLHIYSEATRMTVHETINIIKFAAMSSKIEEVSFHSCLLPQSLDCEPVLKIVSDRNIKVSWAPDAFGTYFLDHCGLWERKDGSKLDDSAYEKGIIKSEMYV